LRRSVKRRKVAPSLQKRGKGSHASSTSSYSLPAVYCGRLKYEDSDEGIEVSRFIVRTTKEIAFDLVTDWGVGAKWRYSGVAILRESGLYSANGLVGSQVVGQDRTIQSVPCNILLSIHDQSDKWISVTGDWHEQGSVYPFEGRLRKFVPTNK
jgi:hypothetical protein